MVTREVDDLRHEPAAVAALVGRAEGAGVLASLGHFEAVLGAGDEDVCKPCGGAVQAEGYSVALAGLAGGVQCRKRGGHHAERTGGVAKAHRHIDGVGIGAVAVDGLAVQKAAPCPERGIVIAGSAGLCTLLAVAVYLAHDELGEFLFQRIVVKSLLSERGCTDIGDKDISVRKQLVDDFAACLGRGIDADCALIGVEVIEKGVALIVRRCADGNGPFAEIVAALGVFKLYDIRAPVCHHSAAGRRRVEILVAERVDEFADRHLRFCDVIFC